MDKAKAGGSGKAKESDPAEKLRVLLHEPKSALTKLDMSVRCTSRSLHKFTRESMYS